MTTEINDEAATEVSGPDLSESTSSTTPAMSDPSVVRAGKRSPPIRA
jgi:hypothetical protein